MSAVEVLTAIVVPVLSAVLGGIVGALIGYRGALKAQAVEDARRNNAAGRAVLAEMLVNVERAMSAESTRLIHELLDNAWRQQLPMVSQLLAWTGLKKLVDVYDAAERAFENAKDRVQVLDQRQRALAEAPPVMGQELKRDAELSRIENERKKIDAWFRTVARDWIEAMRVLQTVVLERKEQSVFADDLRRIEERLKSAEALGD